MAMLYFCFFLFGVALCQSVSSSLERTREQKSILQDDAGGYRKLLRGKTDGSTGRQVIQPQQEVVLDNAHSNKVSWYPQEPITQQRATNGKYSQTHQRLLTNDIHMDSNSDPRWRSFISGFYPRRDQYDGQDVPNPKFYSDFRYTPFLNYGYGSYGRFPQYGFPYYGYPYTSPYDYYPYSPGPTSFYGPYERKFYQPRYNSGLSYDSDRNRRPVRSDDSYSDLSGYVPSQRGNQGLGQLLPRLTRYETDSARNYMNRGSLQRTPSGQTGQPVINNDDPLYSNGERLYNSEMIPPTGYQPFPRQNSYNNQQLPNSPYLTTYPQDSGMRFQLFQPDNPNYLNNIAPLTMDDRNPSDGTTLRPNFIDQPSRLANNVDNQDRNNRLTGPSVYYRQNQGRSDNGLEERDGVSFPMGSPPMLQDTPPYNEIISSQGRDVSRYPQPELEMNRNEQGNRDDPMDINTGPPLTNEQIIQLFGQSLGQQEVGDGTDRPQRGGGNNTNDDFTNMDARQRQPRNGPDPSLPDVGVPSSGSESQAQGQSPFDFNGKSVPREYLNEVSRMTSGTVAKAR